MARRTVKKKAISKRAVKRRRKNPAVSRERQIRKAMELFIRFREEDPEFVDEIAMDYPEAAMLIGKLDAVEYTTSRKGKIELYRHEFNKRARPLLASSFDGKQLLVLGGRYNFTEDGIKDY